ncbi:Dynein assembly factor 1, axonemal [Habropoda laboriosa]|uniref:Dynein axonemal assembly factor 1 homolog n=1 Tax=Habropoda laboriosa TaxID=597456 RepID=A0A0L7R8W6_9HYME|nr:Dynein assembly factor 1, axonemal [Habropoda laboriosa]
MQEECDFQANIVEKRSSGEARLDVPASSASLSKTEIKNSIPTDSIVDFEVLATSSSDVLTKMGSEWEKNELDQQVSTLKSTPESIPEADNEDDSNWLSYFDCSAMFDVTCENLSYYNSTKAEKDSDSDLDDTLMFDDAEEGDTCCANSYCQQSFEDSCEKKIHDFDPSFIDAKSEDVVSDQSREDLIKTDVENEDCAKSDVKSEHSVTIIEDEVIEEVRTEKKSSESLDFSSDSEEESDRNFVYSSPNVNINDYFEYRDSMKEPKFEASLEEADEILSKKKIKDSVIIEEIVEESCGKVEFGQEAKEAKTEETLVEDFTESDVKHADSGSPEEYLEKLAEITELVCPKTEEEVRETLKKIAEGKAEIENRKNEALKDLSVEFNNIEKFVAETKSLEGYNSDSDDSVDEVKKNTEIIEMPLTKDQVAENFKSKNSQKFAEEEEKRRTEMLLQECLQVIPRKIETEEFYPEKEISEEKPESEISEESETMTAKMVVNGIVEDIMADTEDSLFWEFRKEPERTYIKGKVYDFDEKKHTIRMTEAYLKKHCKLNKLYQTPHLNDVLYLHYKGFSFIENLEKYTGLKCLWLENNGIREIANLENQSELKCLYLHNNLIKKIENLECLTRLDTLNLSYNTIRRIENLDSLKFLNTLNLSHNYLQETADIEHLRSLDSLSVLDISHNRIETDHVVNVRDTKELRVISLMGNPVLKTIQLYRKTMILKCKNLKYLDDRPVFPRDRACAEAWMRGGPDEEAAERKRWIEAEQKKINDSVQALINKRKLCKPVETSKKEAEDKKKTKEDEEVATDTVVCTSSELLKLEGRKKKSDGSSSAGSSASSSSDEEVENVEEDGTGQKGVEKSDGRRPMAEEGRKASSQIGEEILLPWRAKAPTCRTAKKLVEEIEEAREYVAGDAEHKRLGKKILDERRSIDDPPGGHALGRELAHYEKLVLETSNETNEITPACYEQGTKHDTGEQKLTKDSSVSCDIFYSMEAREKKEGKIVDTVNEEGSSSNDIFDNRRGNTNSHPLSNQLSSIREDMKEFCADMDKFVEENKIVFKNGEEEKESSRGMKEEENFKWWSTKERKLKVREIMKKREEEKTYPEREDNSIYSEATEKEENEQRFSSVFDSFFMEMDQKSGIDVKSEKMSRTTSSRELLAIEEVEEGVEETVESSIDGTSKLDNDQEATKKKCVKIEILEANPVNITDDDESDNESVKTVINNYESPEINTEVNVKSNSAISSDTLKNVQVLSDVEIRNTVTEKSNNSSKSHKRTCDSEYLNVVSKKSHLIEEIDVEKDSSDRRSASEVTARCRQHMLREAKKFMKKESPLIDKCIESLITNKDSEGKWNLRKCHQKDFLTVNSNFLSYPTPENSQKSLDELRSLEKEQKSDSHNTQQSDVQSIARILKESEDAEKSMPKKGANLFQEFCAHLQQMNSKKKLLIEPDFMKSSRVDPEEKKRDVSSPMETKQSSNEQTKPLIEVISETSTNVDDVEEPEETLAYPEDCEMDPALKEKILRSINAPKTDEQRERGKKSAEKLKRISREAMAKGKLLLERSSANGSDKLEIDDSRKFFMNLLKDDPAQEVEDADSNRNIDEKDENSSKKILTESSQECTIKTDETKELPFVNNDGSDKNDKILHAERENGGMVRKSLEMQVVEQQ